MKMKKKRKDLIFFSGTASIWLLKHLRFLSFHAFRLSPIHFILWKAQEEILYTQERVKLFMKQTPELQIQTRIAF